MEIRHASHLSDQELTTALRRLAQDERETTVALIVHLAEFPEPDVKALRAKSADGGDGDHSPDG